MKKTYKLFIYTCFVASLLLIGLVVQAQPGCPAVNAGPDVTVGCGNNCTTLTATVVPTGSTTSYSVSSIPYAPPYPYNSGTPILVNIDDTWSNVITLPFTFCYYNTSNTQLVAGSNGLITFDLTQAGGYCPWSFSATCPSSSLPLNSIFGPYHDIDPGVSGTMYSGISGSYPCRTYVVNWNQVAMFSCNSLIATHQIVLYESTNIIEVYMQSKPLCSSWNSGNALVGIQDASGTVGMAAPGRNTSAWTANNEAWRFTPNGASSVTVNWYNGATLLGTGTTIQVCPNATTTYTAEAIYNTCSGTTVTVTDQVTVNYNSAFSVSVNPTSANLCQGDNVTLTASAPGSVTYTWTPAAGLNTTSGPTVTATPTTTTTYTVTGVDNTNCSVSVPITVNVTPTPIVSITPSATSVCPGNPVTLTGAGATTYTWAGNGLSATSGNPVTATINSASTYTVTGSTNGCTGTASVAIGMNPNLNVSVTPSNPTVCAGQGVLLAASGGDTYVWSPGTGLSATTGDTVTASPLTTTTYYVTGSSNGCTGQTSVTVGMNGPLNISISPSNPGICLGGSIGLTASGAVDYVWSPPNFLSSDSGAAVVASPITTSTYTVVGTDAYFCQGTGYVTITVTPPNSLSFIPANPRTCMGEPIDIQVFGGASYSWAPPQGLSTTSGSQVSANPFATTTYTVTGNNNGCSVVGTVQVEVIPAPLVDFYADYPDGCEDLLVQFFDQSTPPAVSWQWNFGDGTTPNAFTSIPNPQHLYIDNGTYDVSLQVTTADGCQAQLTVPQMINVHQTPLADFFTNPQQAWILDPGINFFDLSLDADQWFWDFGDEGAPDNYSNTPSPSHMYSDTGYYYITLVVESPEGCLDTMIKQIYIEPNIAFYIPNSFTPNQDGKNDVYFAQGDGVDESTFIMRIYDRWGKQVFFSVDPHHGWNGKLPGSDKVAPAGVYSYFITFLDVKGKFHDYYGTLNLIR